MSSHPINPGDLCSEELPKDGSTQRASICQTSWVKQRRMVSQNSLLLESP